MTPKREVCWLISVNPSRHSPSLYSRGAHPRAPAARGADGGGQRVRVRVHATRSCNCSFIPQLLTTVRQIPEAYLKAQTDTRALMKTLI